MQDYHQHPLISLIIVKAIFSSLIISSNTWPALVGIVWTDPSHGKYGRLLPYYHHCSNTITRNFASISCCGTSRWSLGSGEQARRYAGVPVRTLGLFHNTPLDGGEINSVIVKSPNSFLSHDSPTPVSIHPARYLVFIWNMEHRPDRYSLLSSKLLHAFIPRSSPILILKTEKNIKIKSWYGRKEKIPFIWSHFDFYKSSSYLTFLHKFAVLSNMNDLQAFCKCFEIISVSSCKLLWDLDADDWQIGWLPTFSLDLINFAPLHCHVSSPI